MSYLRGDPYVYESAEGFEFHTSEGNITIQPDVFDALVAMRWYEMTPAEQKAAMLRAYELSGGNCGCEAIAKALGKPGVYEMTDALIKAMEADPDAH